MEHQKLKEKFSERLTELCQDYLEEGLLLADFVREMEANKIFFTLKKFKEEQK